MKLTIDELETKLTANDVQAKEIRADRGRRYGKPYDTLHNVRMADGGEQAWRGAYGSSVECLNRIGNYFFTRMGDMTKQDLGDFRDACIDLENYSRYIRVLFEQKLEAITDCDKPKGKVVPFEPQLEVTTRDNKTFNFQGD